MGTDEERSVKHACQILVNMPGWMILSIVIGKAGGG